MFYFNPDNVSKGTRIPDEQLEEALRLFREAVKSGEHAYVTLEWLHETTGRK